MSSAIISVDGRYRYWLTRNVGSNHRVCVFIMLNPSTANAEEDDPTIRRCVGFARRFNCGKLFVVNLFAYRATKRKDMLAARDPVGEDNKHYVDLACLALRHTGGVLICGWGTDGGHMGQYAGAKQ